MFMKHNMLGPEHKYDYAPFGISPFRGKQREKRG